MNHPIFLSDKDVAELACSFGLNKLMDGLIERLETAFFEYCPEHCVIPPRDGFHYHDPYVGLVEWMPLMKSQESVLMKIVGYHPDNPITHKLPTILSTSSLFDVQTGQMKVLTDGTFLTALRTGAASAIASRHLAVADSSTLGLIGNGAQAMSQLHALSRLFPLKRVLLFDTDVVVSQTFAQRIAPLKMRHLDIRIESLQTVVEESDILCVATAVEKDKGPVFDDSLPHKSWLHINAVGSDLPGKIEVPKSFLQRSLVCPDFLSQAMVEGECQQLEETEVGPDLHELLKNQKDFEDYKAKTTVFDSTGFALEDHVVLEFLLELSIKYSIGTPLDLNHEPTDPYNPYETAFLHSKRKAPKNTSNQLITP